MKKLCAVAGFMLLVAGSANAGKTGIINQAGPYEAQMQFYLHPAHGFPPEPAAQAASIVDSTRPVAGASAQAGSAKPVSKPVVRASPAPLTRSDRVAAAVGD